MASRRVVGSDLYHSNGLHVQYQPEGRYVSISWTGTPRARTVYPRYEIKNIGTVATSAREVACLSSTKFDGVAL